MENIDDELFVSPIANESLIDLGLRLEMAFALHLLTIISHNSDSIVLDDSYLYYRYHRCYGLVFPFFWGGGVDLIGVRFWWGSSFSRREVSFGIL